MDEVEKEIRRGQGPKPSTATTLPQGEGSSYSYLSDSIGSNRAAFHAGHSPKIMPMPTLAKKPAIGAHSGT